MTIPTLMKAITQTAGLPPDISPLFTTQQAAAYLGMAITTLEQARVSGVNCPPFVKIGRSVRYRLGDLEAFVAQRVCFNTSQFAA